MIVVELDGFSDPEVVEFGAATRFSTDEHNNLTIWCGPAGDMLLHVFAARVWRTVGADPEELDG